MIVNGIEYTFDKVLQINRPTLYPGESTEDWQLPQAITDDFNKLNSLLEAKYSVEFLKICAFYNKMFPSLKNSGWSQVAYNASPFTWQNQERTDTGTGISTNYMKQIVDQITSRLGTIQFVPYLLSEDQNYEYIIYHRRSPNVSRNTAILEWIS